MASAVLLTYERKPSVSRNSSMKQAQSASNGYLIDRGHQASSYAPETVAESNGKRTRFSGPYSDQNVATLDNRQFDSASGDSCSLKRKSMSLNGHKFRYGLLSQPRSCRKLQRRRLRKKLKMDLQHVLALAQKVEARERQVRELVHSVSIDQRSDGFASRLNGHAGGFESPNRGSIKDGRIYRHPQIAIPEASFEAFGMGDKAKRTPKANQLYANSEFVSGKDKFPSHDRVKSRLGSFSKRSLQKIIDPPDVKRQKLDLYYRKKLTDLLKQCRAILKKLMTHKFGWVFNEPVDPVTLNLHDYHKVIKKPMDLGTIKMKLDSSEYVVPTELAEDVRLTFTNAMQYNPPGHDVHMMAVSLKSIFEEKWKTLDDKCRALEVQHERIMLEVGNETSSHYAQVPAQQFLTPLPVKPTIAAPKCKLLPQSTAAFKSNSKAMLLSRRDMTFAEKQALSDNLGNLPPKKLEQALQIMSKNTNLTQTDDGIEVEIDSFDMDTLWELHNLVLDSLKASGEHHEKVDRSPKGDQVGPSQSQVSTLRSPKISQKGEGADEDVDIGDELPGREIAPVVIDKDRGGKANNSSSSSSSGSGSSSCGSDSGSSSGSDSDGVDVQSREPVAKTSQPDKEPMGSGVVSDQRGSPTLDVDGAKRPMSDLDEEHVPSAAKVSLAAAGSQDDDGKEMTEERKHRAALLRSRFAETILKAQEKNLPVNKGDLEKLKRDWEEIERLRKEERARLQAEAKAAETAQRKAEVEAAAEAKRHREEEREAARRALIGMERTVEIDENSEILRDLEMLGTTVPEDLPSSADETSPVLSPDGRTSFVCQSRNPPLLEQLGLFMKDDEDEERDADDDTGSADEDEEGEIED